MNFNLQGKSSVKKLYPLKVTSNTDFSRWRRKFLDAMPSFLNGNHNHKIQYSILKFQLLVQYLGLEILKLS